MKWPLLFFRPRPNYAGRIWKRKFPALKTFTLPRMNLKAKQSPVILNSYFKKLSGRKITCLSWGYRFQKAPSQNTFLDTKTKIGVFKFVRFEKSPKSSAFVTDPVSVDGRSNRWNKAVFQISPGKSGRGYSNNTPNLIFLRCKPQHEEESTKKKVCFGSPFQTWVLWNSFNRSMLIKLHQFRAYFIENAPLLYISEEPIYTKPYWFRTYPSSSFTRTIPRCS